MENPTDEDIKPARSAKELTQSGVVEKAGVSQPLVARLESADVDPTVDTLSVSFQSSTNRILTWMRKI